MWAAGGRLWSILIIRGSAGEGESSRWRRPDSNRRPLPCKGSALPTELRPHDGADRRVRHSPAPRRDPSLPTLPLGITGRDPDASRHKLPHPRCSRHTSCVLVAIGGGRACRPVRSKAIVVSTGPGVGRWTASLRDDLPPTRSSSPSSCPLKCAGSRGLPDSGDLLSQADLVAVPPAHLDDPSRNRIEVRPPRSSRDRFAGRRVSRVSHISGEVLATRQTQVGSGIRRRPRGTSRPLPAPRT